MIHSIIYHFETHKAQGQWKVTFYGLDQALNTISCMKKMMDGLTFLYICFVQKHESDI